MSAPETPVTVLHVTECYAGGVKRAIDTIVELTPEFDHVLLFSGDEEPTEAQGFGRVIPLGSAASATGNVARAVREIEPSVVHAHSSWAGVFTRVKRLPVPVVYEPHCYKFDDTEQFAPLRVAYRLAEKALAPRAERIVVLSPHEDGLAKSLDGSSTTHFLPNVASMVPAPGEATGFATDDHVFMIGRLSRQKDPDFFLDLARRVRATRPATRFTWVGDGETAVRERLLAEGVALTGWVTGDRLRDILAAPGLYVHTAQYEGFPLSVLDAAAFEHPIVARRIPAWDGFAVPGASTAPELADLVVDALDGGDVADAATAAARGFASTMTPEAQRSSLVELYTSVSGR